MSEIESSSPPVADAGALLGKLLSNPDLLRNISSAIGSSATAGAVIYFRYFNRTNSLSDQCCTVFCNVEVHVIVLVVFFIPALIILSCK
ncbi:MAG: hypothetical protein IJB94_00105 [Clostridia bacterium]|nr:hypothetical protein [Clostridia bacterium]